MTNTAKPCKNPYCDFINSNGDNDGISDCYNCDHPENCQCHNPFKRQIDIEKNYRCELTIEIGGHIHKIKRLTDQNKHLNDENRRLNDMIVRGSGEFDKLYNSMHFCILLISILIGIMVFWWTMR